MDGVEALRSPNRPASWMSAIAKLVAGDDPAGAAFHLPLASEPGVIMGTLPYNDACERPDVRSAPLDAGHHELERRDVGQDAREVGAVVDHGVEPGDHLVARVALVQINRAERVAREAAGQLSTQAAELRDKTDALEKALQKSKENEAENRKLLKQTQDASEQAEIERDRSRSQQKVAERARDEATRAARQARIEKANAERAVRETGEARKEEEEEAERAKRIEQDRKLLRERAVGPIQQGL